MVGWAEKWRDSREQEMLLACNKPLYAEDEPLEIATILELYDVYLIRFTAP